ncbi:MAG: sigma-70 family RNA polymerase sigma factor [Deltaproteobacteria bacterium]|nr:sigma-70 family RNA polymerase sigma factor [Deltaproteobacteria bacterium]
MSAGSSDLDDLDDLALLERWRAGVREAGAVLYRRHFASVSAYFRTRVPEALEDLIADTFLAMVESRDRFRGDSAFKTYLFKIARNVYATWLRKNCKREITPASDSIAELSGVRQSSLLVKAEELRILLEALRSVSIDDQDLLELYYFQELTAVQVAEIFGGMREATVRSRLRAALGRLATRYEVIAGRSPAQGEDAVVDLFKDWLGVLRGQVRHFGSAPDDGEPST